MATVHTVTGPVDAAELGPTLVHEHIRVAYPGDELDPTGQIVVDTSRLFQWPKGVPYETSDFNKPNSFLSV